MMESLPHLKGRIASLSEFHDLIRALRALAGTHAREAQSALSSARAYLATVEDAISRIAELLPTDAGPQRTQETSPDVLLVILSEHGFVGGYNDRLLEKALAAHREPENIFIVGRRGKLAASEIGVVPDGAFSMTTHVGGIGPLAREINDALFWAHRVRIVYARHRPGALIDWVITTALPLDHKHTRQMDTAPAPLHHLTPRELATQLTSELLFAKIAQALMSGLVSENVARLQAMETANRNVEDKLKSLHQTERTLNQEAATAELLDVITGAKAVAGAQD